MPASLRRQTARLRASYTRETASLAAPGIPRRDSNALPLHSGLGLDACSAPQRRLRALLALGMFNNGPTSWWPRLVTLADVTRYTFVVSARHDDLVITARAPYNVACWLVGRERLPQIGLPGLRVDSSYEDGWRLRHLPTGATMSVTGDRHGRLRGPLKPDSNYARLWTTDVLVSDEEHAVLNRLPRLSADTETMLAALTVRLCAHAPDGSWDIGMWFNDLTDRPGRGHAHHRRLSVEGDRCTLHWDSEPYPEDLRAALTGPVIGLAGTRIQPTGDGWNLRYGRARLLLVPWRSGPEDTDPAQGGNRRVGQPLALDCPAGAARGLCSRSTRLRTGLLDLSLS
ncbi:hypothetical protein ABZ567_28460 [Streptomyces sp. NPDC016459]|uniref:hypothetical protein n=1 Tax=Streptomyces sp. NPDC016459 TaxID=3157190 RepID=UPI00340E73E3